MIKLTDEIYVMSDGTFAGEVYMDSLGRVYRNGGMCTWESTFGHHPTHWMPLPKPPKEDEV